MNIWKNTKVFGFFYGPQSFWKENISDRVKYLRTPQESAPLGHIFCLTGHECCLSAELKFRENTVGYPHLCGLPRLPKS